MSDPDLRQFLVGHIRAARAMTLFDADQLAESIVPIRRARHIPMEDVLEWMYSSTEPKIASAEQAIRSEFLNAVGDFGFVIKASPDLVRKKKEVVA